MFRLSGVPVLQSSAGATVVSFRNLSKVIDLRPNWSVGTVYLGSGGELCFVHTGEEDWDWGERAGHGQEGQVCRRRRGRHQGSRDSVTVTEFGGYLNGLVGDAHFNLSTYIELCV